MQRELVTNKLFLDNLYQIQMLVWCNTHACLPFLKEWFNANIERHALGHFNCLTTVVASVFSAQSRLKISEAPPTSHEL